MDTKDPGTLPSGIWTENFKSHSYEVDLKQLLTVEAACRRFVEAAWNHAEALGVGFSHLAKRNQLWVLSRLLVKMKRYPRWGEAVVVNTWPRASQSLFAMRDFELLDGSRATLVSGSSAWLILDADTRKPQRIQNLLSSIPALPDRRATNEDPERVPNCASPAESMTAKVSYSDIDVNGHVTSARYVRWIFDSYPVDFHRSHAATLLEINYLGETLGGDAISVLSQEVAPNQFCHSILKVPGAEPVCRARVHWTADPI